MSRTCISNVAPKTVIACFLINPGCSTADFNDSSSPYRGKAKSHAVGPEDHEYELDLQLFGAVSPDDSKISVTARSVFLLISKKEAGEEYWPRLTKAKAKQPNVKVRMPFRDHTISGRISVQSMLCH